MSEKVKETIEGLAAVEVSGELEHVSPADEAPRRIA